MRLPKLTIPRVVAVCTIVAIYNGVYLEFLRRHGGWADNPFYPIHVTIRELMLTPGSLILHGLFIVGSLWNAFLRPRCPEWLKLATVFIVVMDIYGLLLLYFFDL